MTPKLNFCETFVGVVEALCVIVDGVVIVAEGVEGGLEDRLDGRVVVVAVDSAVFVGALSCAGLILGGGGFGG